MIARRATETSIGKTVLQKILLTPHPRNEKQLQNQVPRRVHYRSRHHRGHSQSQVLRRLHSEITFLTARPDR